MIQSGVSCRRLAAFNSSSVSPPVRLNTRLLLFRICNSNMGAKRAIYFGSSSRACCRFLLLILAADSLARNQCRSFKLINASIDAPSGPPDRPNRGFFYGPSYESIWTNDFHYKACCGHEKNYFQFDGEGDTVGRPQTLLMRSWRLDMEQQAREQHVAARIGTSSKSKPLLSQAATPAPPSPAPAPPLPYLPNCSPELCPPFFRPAGVKRYSLSPDKPPPPSKEFARELWDPTHTRILYMKTAKPTGKPAAAHHMSTSLPRVLPTASPVSPEKAMRQLREQQEKEQQEKEQQGKEQQRHAALRSVRIDEGSGSVLLTRDGEVRRDYVLEVRRTIAGRFGLTGSLLQFCFGFFFPGSCGVAGEDADATHGAAAAAGRP
jgi:hypothetical protein